MSNNNHNNNNNNNPALSANLPALTASTCDTDTTTSSLEDGYLEICILSAYDLPNREPPRGIQIHVVDEDGTVDRVVTTGPPIQRHKDRNSFKFAPTTTTSTDGTNGSATSMNEIQIRAPLSKLYHAKVVFTVLYDQEVITTTSTPSSSPLQVEYALNRCKIHDPQWLVLNLVDSDGNETNGGEDDTTTSTSFRVPPTLRCKITLHGPYRTEIAAACQVASVWFQWIDSLESSGALLVQRLPDPQWFLVPTVPLVAVAVVSTPVVAGVMVVALPMVLPILVVVALATTALAASALFLYASTRRGRQEWLQPLLHPVVDTLLDTSTGQRCVYQTGPRPTPVHLCRIILPRESLWGKLAVSLWIDLMGSASYLLPVVGEGFDVAWAPVQTIFIMAMYDDVAPNLKYVSFVEEILPFTDIVPSATIGWLTEFGVPWVEHQLGMKLTSEQTSTTQPQKRGRDGRSLVTTTPSTPFSTPRW